ncbi:C-type lectin domain family 17, member A-like [Ostrea edulis]|uniref:C-type lectin domain family 17, member A-like n=1 Tax=Ostrea edulis TaxID=37623 RepID=UPI0024AF9B2E|nr:C-type lectin domain family 17, member A-like [Ostrea edulis]
MFSGTSEVDAYGDYRQYFIVVNKLFSVDFIARANLLCSGNNSGYIFDAAAPICYKINTIPRTKSEAIDFCQESGGHLLRIKTDKKQKFVEVLPLEETDSIQKYRIDGENIDEEWKFSNGERITRFYWYPGEPNGHYNSIGLRVEHGGKWDDVKNNNEHGCICEKEIE